MPHLILELPLRTIEDTWLALRCCFGTVYLPILALSRRHGSECLLGDAMVRLRCQHCHEMPVGFALVDGPRLAGAAPGWSLPLDM